MSHLPEICKLYDAYAVENEGGSLTLNGYQFLKMLEALGAFGEELSAADAVSVITKDNPLMYVDQTLDMRVEMSHLEMIECLVGCAVHERPPPDAGHEEVLLEEELEDMPEEEAEAPAAAGDEDAGEEAEP